MLPENLQKTGECLSISPHQYGDPLRKTLKRYWELRVGDYRVVY
jgi:mRNA interferase RelE/StbE